MIHLLQGRLPITETINLDPRSESHTIDAEIRRIRVVRDLPRIVARAEKTGILPRPGERSFDEERGQVHAIRDAIGSRSQIIES